MRKAFTLIELMIAILLTTIFLNFVFKFYTNVLIELRYLEARDSLTYNAFRVSQIIKNGVYGNSAYIGGVITLDNRTDSNNFKSHDGNDINIIADGNLTIKNTLLSQYKFQDLNIKDFSLKDDANVSNGLYVFELNITKDSLMKFSELNETSYIPYQRLVYTK